MEITIKVRKFRFTYDSAGLYVVVPGVGIIANVPTFGWIFDKWNDATCSKP